jgi:hypothetical protein
MTVVDITGSLFTITENGFGKRSPIDEYRMTHRGSKGVRTIVTNKRNGNVVFVSQVTDDHELIITTEHGMTVRIPVRDIREQGRNTMGVRIMRLNEGDKVVSVTQVVAEPIKEGEGAESIESLPLGIIEEKPVEEPPQPAVKRREPRMEEKPSPEPPESKKPERKTAPPLKAKKTPPPKKPKGKLTRGRKAKVKPVKIKQPKKPKKKSVKAKKTVRKQGKKPKKPIKKTKVPKVKEKRKAKPAKPKKGKKRPVKKPVTRKKAKRKK